MRNILITGRPSAGKTTLIKRIVESLTSKGRRVGGFYTEEIREGSTRVGFRIKTLDGQEGILSHKDLKSPFRVGKYFVNIEDLENIANPALEKGIKESDIIVIDEIAKMEFYSARFKEITLRALESPKDLIATLQNRPNPFIDKIKNRKDVEILTITFDNRDKLVDTIVGRFR